jgi:hypothetical protein
MSKIVGVNQQLSEWENNVDSAILEYTSWFIVF